MLVTKPVFSAETKPVRGLFVSVIQNPTTLSSAKAMDELIEYSKKANIKILFVQVYRANKSWFKSAYADSTPYEECLQSVSEDAFSLLIKKAHDNGIEVHAWLNLMSLSANEKAPILKKYGSSVLTRNVKKKKTLQDYRIDNQYFLDPGDTRVRHELLRILGELLKSYPQLDGVQFDYIRYPDVHPAYGYNEINKQRFKNASGHEAPAKETMEWMAWKRQQVTSLLRLLVYKTHQMRPGMTVSTTGLVSYRRAYYEACQDWKYWVDSGLIDFVTLMNYSKDTARVGRCIADAKRRISDHSKINLGVGAYKLLDDPETFKTQFQMAETAGCRMSVTFHYGDLVEKPLLAKVLEEA